MHGVGKGLSSVTVAPDRAAAKDLGAVETVCTVVADCTMAETDGAASDTHGQGYVYAISGLRNSPDRFLVLMHV
jgi:hypothetical protein